MGRGAARARRSIISSIRPVCWTHPLQQRLLLLLLPPLRGLGGSVPLVPFGPAWLHPAWPPGLWREGELMSRGIAAEDCDGSRAERPRVAPHLLCSLVSLSNPKGNPKEPLRGPDGPKTARRSARGQWPMATTLDRGIYDLTKTEVRRDVEWVLWRECSHQSREGYRALMYGGRRRCCCVCLRQAVPSRAKPLAGSLRHAASGLPWSRTKIPP